MGFFELPRKRKTAGAMAAALDAATGWERSSPSTEVARKTRSTRRTIAWFGIVCAGVHCTHECAEGGLGCVELEICQDGRKEDAAQFDTGGD